MFEDREVLLKLCRIFRNFQRDTPKKLLDSRPQPFPDFRSLARPEKKKQLHICFDGKLQRANLKALSSEDRGRQRHNYELLPFVIVNRDFDERTLLKFLYSSIYVESLVYGTQQYRLQRHHGNGRSPT